MKGGHTRSWSEEEHDPVEKQCKNNPVRIGVKNKRKLLHKEELPFEEDRNG